MKLFGFPVEDILSVDDLGETDVFERIRVRVRTEREYAFYSLSEAVYKVVVAVMYGDQLNEKQQEIYNMIADKRDIISIDAHYDYSQYLFSRNK